MSPLTDLLGLSPEQAAIFGTLCIPGALCVLAGIAAGLAGK